VTDKYATVGVSLSNKRKRQTSRTF